MRKEEEFRARVDTAVEHTQEHLEDFRAALAARPLPLDRTLVGFAIRICDGRRERDTVMPLGADDFEFWRQYLTARASRSDHVDPSVFETTIIKEVHEPRLIERLPYLAWRSDTRATLTHALVGAISRWRVATPDEMETMN